MAPSALHTVGARLMDTIFISFPCLWMFVDPELTAAAGMNPSPICQPDRRRIASRRRASVALSTNLGG
jgi:hypothetical protein